MIRFYEYIIENAGLKRYWPMHRTMQVIDSFNWKQVFILFITQLFVTMCLRNSVK